MEAVRLKCMNRKQVHRSSDQHSKHSPRTAANVALDIARIAAVRGTAETRKPRKQRNGVFFICFATIRIRHTLPQCLWCTGGVDIYVSTWQASDHLAIKVQFFISTVKL